ncbi:MAG: hypothetical protein ACOX4D_02115 [Bacteroidales bacterium]
MLLTKTNKQITNFTQNWDSLLKIICYILSQHDEKIEEDEIATTLGFNVKDNFDVNPKRYADIAELQLFREIVKPVFEWGLISKTKDSIIKYSITELGKRALVKNEKYKFYHGNKVLFENYGINAKPSIKNDFFPFFNELNIYSEITNQQQIKFSDIDISIFDIDESDLIKRIHLQSASRYNIYYAEETNYFDIESEKVDYRIYMYNHTYYPIVFSLNKLCPEATDLINNEVNNNLKNNKIEWGLYLRLMNDENAVLDYKTIAPFEDILVLDDLIPDKRLAWDDEALFALITENADANQISLISTHCPINTIKKHIEDGNIQWDWLVLSQRIDENFILEKPSLNWNFEIISSRKDISIDTIKSLLENPNLQNTEWNWDNIMPQLDFEFIKNNIQNVNFDLFELTTKNNEEVKKLICQNVNKKWDWSFISNEYDLGFILDHIKIFSYTQENTKKNYLNLKIIIDRAFHSQQFAEIYLTSSIFKDILIANKSSLSNYSTNTVDFFMEPKLNKIS